MTRPTPTERLREFVPIFNACKDDTERHLLCDIIREGKTFAEFTEGDRPPYNVTELVMVDIVKSKSRQH